MMVIDLDVGKHVDALDFQLAKTAAGDRGYLAAKRLLWRSGLASDYRQSTMGLDR